MVFGIAGVLISDFELSMTQICLCLPFFLYAPSIDTMTSHREQLRQAGESHFSKGITPELGELNGEPILD